MRKLLTVLVSSMVLVGVLATEAWAPAPRGSIQQGGLVLKKLASADPSSNRITSKSMRRGLVTEEIDVPPLDRELPV